MRCAALERCKHRRRAKKPQPAGIVRGNKQAAPPPSTEAEALINLYQIIMQQRRESPLIFILNKAALASGRERERVRDIMETTEARVLAATPRQ
jgi:hypothetical protein